MYVYARSYKLCISHSIAVCDLAISGFSQLSETKNAGTVFMEDAVCFIILSVLCFLENTAIKRFLCKQLALSLWQVTKYVSKGLAAGKCVDILLRNEE